MNQTSPQTLQSPSLAQKTSPEPATNTPEPAQDLPRFKKYLPLIIIGSVLALIIILCLVFAKPDTSDSSLSSNIDDTSINWGQYSGSTIELSDSLKITSGGVYTLSGTISDGLIEIDTTKDVKLILNNVSVSNSSGPALLVSNADTVVIETAEGTTNYFSDGSSYRVGDEDISAVIFSKDDLVLQGSGTLVVEGNYEDGIVSKDDLKVASGILQISAKDDGLRGRDSVYISGGNLTITSGGDAIKSNNDEDSAKGTVLIDDGTLTLSASDDGIHAESTLEINGGKIDVQTSYEGLEAARITINGGEISIVASDDGLNAAGGNDGSSPNVNRYTASSSNYSLVINGGTIYVNASGDGLDSNGSLTVNGGSVVVDGPTNNGNGALDAEAEVSYNGGFIIAVGASGMAVAPSSSSTGYSLSIFFTQTYPAGTKLTVRDSSGNLLLSHTSAKAFSHAVLSSSSFQTGATYTVLVNDAEYTSLTLSNKTTQSGSGGMGGMMPSNQGGSQPGNQPGAATQQNAQPDRRR